MQKTISIKVEYTSMHADIFMHEHANTKKNAWNIIPYCLQLLAHVHWCHCSCINHMQQPAI